LKTQKVTYDRSTTFSCKTKKGKRLTANVGMVVVETKHTETPAVSSTN